MQTGRKIVKKLLMLREKEERGQKREKRLEACLFCPHSVVLPFFVPFVVPDDQADNAKTSVPSSGTANGTKDVSEMTVRKIWNKEEL